MAGQSDVEGFSFISDNSFRHLCLVVLCKTKYFYFGRHIKTYMRSSHISLLVKYLVDR